MNGKRVLGYIFTVTASFSLLLGLIGFIELWTLRPKAIEMVSGNIKTLNNTLTSTQDGLTILDQEVRLIGDNIQALENTIQALGSAIHSSTPMLNTLGDLTSKDLPATITATQTALGSAQSSAQLIDNVLSGLTSIPFLPVTPYRPEVPLNTALAQVSNSLNTLKPSLTSINSSITASKSNMTVLETELIKISQNTRDMSSAFDGVQAIVNQYKSTTLTLQNQMKMLEIAVPAWLTTITWILTFFLVWFLVAQISLMVHGLTLLGLFTGW